MKIERTNEFVFEYINPKGLMCCLFVICMDGSLSIANLDDINRALASAKLSAVKEVVREVEKARKEWPTSSQNVLKAAKEVEMRYSKEV
jgi:hypothetical protein